MRRLLASLLLAAVCSICGCQAQSARQPQVLTRPQGLQAKDDFGQTISLPHPPQRIVCLAPNVTEIAYALGLGDRIVGVSEFSDYPPAAKQKPLVGRYDRPSMEKIVSLHPDLVLLGYGNPEELAGMLEKAGIACFGVNPRSIKQVLTAIERIGEICGVSEKARQVSAGLLDRAGEVKKKLADQPIRRPRVFILIDDAELWTAGRETLQDEVVRLGGGDNIAAFRTSFFLISKESLIAAQPELILVTGKTREAGRIKAQLMARRELASLPAVKRHAVEVVEADIFSRPGPRVIDGMELVYAIVMKHAGDATREGSQAKR